MAAEEARANTGANLISRLAYGKEFVTDIDDAYDTVGGFRHYLDTEHYVNSFLEKHPLFANRSIPEKLEEFTRTKKEISLRVDMRVNAEYLGQLGELGGGYSTGKKGIKSVVSRNLQEIFDRAYAIDGDLEKAFGYITEYGDILSQVSEESKNVSMSISTLPEIGKAVRTKNIARCK